MLSLTVLRLALALSQGQAVSTGTIFADAARALSSGDLAAASRGFEQVLAREPNNLGALGNLGVVYSRSGQPVKAIAMYRRALQIAPDHPGLLLNLALAYLKLDDHAAAKPLLAKLLTLNPPDRSQAQELLAICQIQTNELVPALQALQHLAQSPAPSPGVLHFLSLAYLKNNQRDLAIGTLARLYDSLPAARAHFLEGRVWYDAALFDSALEAYDKAYALDAKLPSLALELGKTHISLRNSSDAETFLRAALAQDPGDIEASYFLGALLVQNGQHAEGAPLLETVKATRPSLWGTHYYLGKAKLALNQPKAAIPLLQQAAKLSPNESPVQYQLARAYQAAGRALEAKQTFAKVQKLQRQSQPEPLVLR
jgi:tetratricopeptide (TPR) repeat protein